MRAIHTTLLVIFATLLPSCSIEINGVSFEHNLPARTGPEFQEAFPGPAELISTRDVPGTRKLLNTIPLPETRAHHDGLIQALAAVDTIDSEHLVLLTEAVALPPRTGNPKTDGPINITTKNGQVFVFSRGEGEFAPVVDELVLAGAEKLSDVGPESFGRLVTVTQSAKTLVALSDILLEKSDDGSTKALRTILRRIPFSSIREELCLEVLLPRKRLTGARMDVGIESMSFDSNRSKLIGAIYDTLDTLDAATLLRHVKLQSFDSGRIKVVKLGTPILGTLNGSEALQLVQTARFDSGRTTVLELTKSKLRLRSASEALTFVRTSSFDSGRRQTLKTLLETSFPPVTDEDLIALARVASFDGDRAVMLTMVESHFDGKFSESSAKRLLRSFSFDSGRLKVVRTFREHLQRLPVAVRAGILDTFSFSSDKDRAMKLIMR